jgi:hypothetical protein
MTYEWYTPPMGYDQIVALKGEIVKDWTLGYYQGDYVYLLKNDDLYSLVVVGYGSCSGCDALEGCENDEDFEYLKQSIINSIVFTSKEDLIKDLSNTESNRWYFYEEDWEEVQKYALEILYA